MIVLPFALRALVLSNEQRNPMVARTTRGDGAQSMCGYHDLGVVGMASGLGIGACGGHDSAHGSAANNWGCRHAVVMVSGAAISRSSAVLILRAGGVFLVLPLALAALTYTTASMEQVTGGEDGLGGLKRGSVGPFSLDNALTYTSR